MYKSLKGKELDRFFENGIAEKKMEFQQFLSQFDAADLFHKWREFIRRVDELYNISFMTEEDEEDEILYSCGIDIDDDPQFEQLVSIVGCRCGKDVQNRFVESCQMLSLFNRYCYSRGFIWNCCDTLFDAFARCQAMRLYYVTMLMFIPAYAKGSRKIVFTDLLQVFQPMIDDCMVNIRNGYNALKVNKCIKGYEVLYDGCMMKPNFSYNHLEGDFLEPIRMTINDVMSNMSQEEKARLPEPIASQLYGYEELEHNIKLSSVVYDKYGLNEIEEYKQMKNMAKDLKSYLHDNYAFIVSEKDFQRLCNQCSRLKLVCDSDSFDDMLNSRPAFFRFDKTYYSTVLLYQRYMVNAVQHLLDKRKQFQIDSGFVFEKEVKALLYRYGYDVKDVKRIKRKEFDVVCVKDNVIFNFQCKNNSVSVSEQGDDWLKRTCNAIRRLNRYYEKALKKEDDREDLLKEKLGLSTVQSYVISRFPVITRNPRIINYNQLELRLNSI